MATEVVAVIPARGGSKGIPQKNVYPLLGKPLIAYTIESAKAAHQVSRVFVSTDDAHIAAVSRSYGAEVIPRPAELSGDTASSESALIHALEYLKESESYVPDVLVFLQCTSPLTLPVDIDGTIEALFQENADSALSVSATHVFLWQRDSEGNAAGVNHNKAKRPRRQERVPEFVETGAVYVLRVKGFLEARHRFFGKTAMFEIPRNRSFEVDEPADLELIAAVMKLRDSSTRDTLERAARTKLLITDVDGVLTDSGMYYSEQGDELKKFNTRDGVGLEKLREVGIRTAIVTRENTALVARRSEKLKFDFICQGIIEKGACIEELAQKAGVALDEVCFLGDDVHDIPALRGVGFACCPADAASEVQHYCHHRLLTNGGQGCLREAAEYIVRARKATGP